MAGTGGRSTGELQRNMITRVNVGDALSRTATRYPDADVIKTDGGRSSAEPAGREQHSENVASIEVERALYAADARVQEVAVVGLPHGRWSEAITAVVVPVPGADLVGDTLRETLRAHLDGYKIPKSVIVLDELPKTSTGKIQKHVLRDKHSGHYGSA